MTNNYTNEINVVKNAIETQFVKKENIVDNLSTNDANKVLSAKQGKILHDMIQSINTGVELVTNITIVPDAYSVEQNTDISVSGILSAVYDGSVNLIGVLSGASVKIYDGDSLVDTVTTEDDGSYSSTITLSTIGAHSLKAVFEGISNVYDDCESSAVVVYCTNTIINLEVPMNLTYSDAFNITGTLKDTSNNLLEGKTVSLLVGSTEVDTTTTDSNGEFSFTQTPVSMGTHSFQVSWAGDNVYYATVSSVVTREIGKETSVLNVSSPTMNSNVYSDGSLSVAGTLQSNDAEAISNASVLVKQNGSTLTTLTTDSNGAFTGNVNASNLDTGNLDIIFESNSTHTASSASISIVVNDPTLTLVSDKSILSYVDNDVATLTATLQCVNPSNKTVSFDIVDENGDVIENIDSATTDSNGVCSVYYSSNHAGDLNIRAQSGMILSETYKITDYIFFDDCSSNTKLSNYGTSVDPWNANASASLSYDGTQNAYSISPVTNSIGEICIIPITPSSNLSNYRCKMKYKHGANTVHNQPSLYLYNSLTKKGFGARHMGVGTCNILYAHKYDSYQGNQLNPNSYSTGITSQYFTLIIEKQGTSYTFKIEDASGTVVSSSVTDTYTEDDCNTVGMGIYMYEMSRAYYIKEISIEQL